MMNNNTPNTEVRQSKRIVKNSALLFIRMFVIMLINLYAVRVLLKSLGEEDYGVFFSVAGVVTTLTCLSSVLAVSTQRFYSFIQGLGKREMLKSVFSTSLNINILFSALILIVFETAGLYFLNHQLVIPENRLFAANILYHFSVLTFIFTIIQIPYTAAFIANEDMGKYALISAIECVFKFIAALSIAYVSFDGLAYYGICLFIVAITIFASYAIIARKNYEECHYVKVKDKNLYKKLLSFSGWTFFGSVASVGMFQGNTILLNLFFGPLINTAYGIALQINNAFNSFCNSIVIAIRPAMIRSYAEQNYDYLNQLFYISSKAILYFMLLIAIPLFTYMPTVLELWLGDINDNMLLFSRLIIIYIVLITLHHPITIILQAAGYVKQYHLASESVTLLSFPLSYILFKLGLPAWTTFASMIGVSAIAHIVRIICLNRYYKMVSIKKYAFSFLLPGILISLGLGKLSFIVKTWFDDNIIGIIGGALITISILLILIFIIVLDKKERAVMLNLITSKIKK